MSKKILCVDDDANILAGFQRNLRKQFSLDTALGAEEGLKALEANGRYAVVVADMQMPRMNGIQFLIEARKKSPDSVPIMLTGNADQKTAMDAVNQGHVFRFLTKPCPPEILALTLEAGLKQYRLITAERELLERTLNGAIKVLIDVLAMMDPSSFGLGEKLRTYMRTYTCHYNVPQPWALELAAMLSQIGHVAIPATVLMKARSGLGLRPEEKDMLMRIPRTAADLLANIPRLGDTAKIVLYQNKNFDGSGFPNDLVAGSEIPIGARILKALADLIELEGTGRTRSKALAEMRARSGRYDPGVLDSVAVCFDVSIPHFIEATAKTVEVQLKDVTTGQVLADNVETLEGILIVPAGTRVSDMLLEKLRNFDHLKRLRKPLFVNAVPATGPATD